MLSHDTYKDLIGLKSRELFGCTYKWLSEVPAIAGGELRRADLVLIADYAFPYVRVIEVKTRYEDFWNAIEQLRWFRGNGLANYYIIALPRSVARRINYDDRIHLIREGIGLLTFEEKISDLGIKLDTYIEISPKFYIRTSHWEKLYEEVEKRGWITLAKRLRNSLRRSPGGRREV